MKETIGFSDVTKFARTIARLLKWRFPAALFLVTLGKPIRGSIYVQWTDGPTASLVNDVLVAFLAYTDQEENLIRIKTRREISPRFAQRLVAQIACYYGGDAPEVVATPDDLGWTLEGGSKMSVSWETMVSEAAEDATRFSRPYQIAEYNANSLTDRLMKEILAGQPTLHSGKA